jgi:hypothetical protein
VKAKEETSDVQGTPVDHNTSMKRAADHNDDSPLREGAVE